MLIIFPVNLISQEVSPVDYVFNALLKKPKKSQTQARQPKRQKVAAWGYSNCCWLWVSEPLTMGEYLRFDFWGFRMFLTAISFLIRFRGVLPMTWYECCEYVKAGPSTWHMKILVSGMWSWSRRFGLWWSWFVELELEDTLSCRLWIGVRHD